MLLNRAIPKVQSHVSLVSCPGTTVSEYVSANVNYPCFTCFIRINILPSHPNSPTSVCYPHYPDYCAAMRSSIIIYTTHTASSESDTIPLGTVGYGESGHELACPLLTFDGLLICSRPWVRGRYLSRCMGWIMTSSP
jgi:hypothetical protein